jgi:hypothetical protein
MSLKMSNVHVKLLRYTCVFCLLITLSCKKSETTDALNQKNTQISQRFKGKYAIVSAISDQAVDVNLDGIKSSDMLQEIPNLKYSYVELRLSSDLKDNLFVQFWQNQAFPYGNTPTSYNPGFNVLYANQATTGLFNFNDQLTRLNLFRTDSTSQKDFPLPRLVEVIGDDQIHIPTEKTLYTRAGMVPVTIDVVYKRFTNVL